MPLEAVRFLILLHGVGCWLSHLAHLLELAVSPGSSRMLTMYLLSDS